MKTLKYLSLLIFSLIYTSLYSQKPTQVPKPSDKPIDLSNPADLIIYIILPLCVILLFFMYWRRRKNPKE